MLKAIEKDPKARYQSAEAMGEDLQAVPGRRADPGPAGQRRWSDRWRWARRNPWIAALGGVLTGVLVLATVLSLAGDAVVPQAELG